MKPGCVSTGGSPSAGRLKVPGAAAPEIRVAGLLNSLPRLVLRAKCTFGAFVADAIRQPRHPSGATSLFWPMPLPYPEVFRPGAGIRQAWRKKLINVAIAALDWLFLQRPSRVPASIWEPGRR